MSQPTKLLLAGAIIWDLGEGMLGPLLAVFAQRVGGDLLDISWAWATYLVVTGVCIIFVGALADRVGKKRLMMAGFALNALLTFCYLFVSSKAELFLIQAGLGVAAALATPTWDALYSEYEDKDADGYTWGLYEGMRYVVGGIAVILGGLMISTFSFAALFVLMGCVQVVATAAQARILKYK